MASFYKRGSYQWEAKIRRKGYPQICKTFDSKSDAETWAWKTESEMKRGIFVSNVEAESTTLREVLERYLEEVTPLKKGADRESNRLKRWIIHPLAARFLASIRGKDIADFRNEWRKSGLAENTIRLEIALLSQVFETARKEWGMESLANPCRTIKLPASSNQRDRRLADGEGVRLLEALAKGRNAFAAPITKFAIETAMRQGEMLGLTWENVDLKKCVAYLLDTKNGEARDVPLSTPAIEILKSLPRPIEGGKIFRISQDGLIRAFARACVVSDINDLRFHDLRHEATSRLFEKGFSIAEVSAITGHKTLQMLKRYTHLRAEDLARKLG